MNFLAHIYLSGASEKILVGNFIGDFVKGRHFENFPEEIQKGIILHRCIDTYTDSHPIVKRTKSIFSSKYGKFAGVIGDIVYDHFLASNWHNYHQLPLDHFIDYAFDVLENHYEVLPEPVKKFFHRFKEKQWIKTYESLEGIEKVLDGMSKNTSLPDHTSFAMQQLKDYYQPINKHFTAYFAELVNYVIKYHHVSFTSNFICVA
ncbi:MAG: DUF479 domain-containing protein [Bacteroidales bacterium]|nr:DUF479 domain-containing protein [Bacteroidales bacterium]